MGRGVGQRERDGLAMGVEDHMSFSQSRLPVPPPQNKNQGLRITVPGRVGQSLLDVAQMHDIELESGCGGGGAEQQKKHSERWTEDLFGRGECGREGKRGGNQDNKLHHKNREKYMLGFQLC